MKVTIDADRCQGHQMCAVMAPELFGSDDLGNGIVLGRRHGAGRAAGRRPPGRR